MTKSKRTVDKKRKTAKRAAAKAAPKKLAAAKKSPSKSKKKVAPRRARKPARIYDHQEGAAFAPEPAGLRTGGQSGSLQGLRDREAADSESVDELLEEGNSFEAGVVSGVEHAEDNEGREVHTHEVPEDDVPEEYLDKEL